MMEKNNYKYILYARKSTEDEGKQVLSIESQIIELKQLAEKRGLEVLAVLSEAKSAKKEGRRPVFNQMLKVVKQGTAQGIIAWKIDRLARNPMDAAKIQTMLQERVIKHIVTFEKDYLPGDNVLLMTLEFGMANQYIIDLSNNVKRGNRHKLEIGILPGLPPLGYLNHIDQYSNKSIVKDDNTFDLVKRMWGLLLRGERVEIILDKANKQWGLRTRKFRKSGGNPLSLNGIYKMFSNPFYAGIIRRKQDGEIREYKGIHDPMITVTEFDESQYILGRKDRPRPKTHEFTYTGIIRCGECGSMITAEEKSKKTKAGIAHYIYYHCTKRKKSVKCQQKCIRVEEMEKQISVRLENINISDKFRDWGIKHFDELKNNNEKEVKEIIISQKNTLQKTEQSLERLTNLLIDGMLDNEEYAKRKQELLHQKWQLEEKIKQIEDNRQKWLEPARSLILFTNQAKNWFISGNMEEKKDILKTIGSNYILKDKTLLVSYQKPFQIMEGLRANALMWARVKEVRKYFTENDGSNFFSSIIKQKINEFVKTIK